MVKQNKQFKMVAAAGTFDRLHKGHEAFLSRAFQVGERVVLGVTSDQMVKTKPYSRLILPFNERVAELQKFFAKHDWLDRVKIISLEDIYGPAPIDQTLEAIVVTKNTLPNAKLINHKRKLNGFELLVIVEVDLVFGIDQTPIASRKIRSGRSDRHGNVFSHPKLSLVPRKISLEERVSLKKPLGKVILGYGHDLSIAAKSVSSHLPSSCPFLAVVGDVATRSLLSAGLRPSLAVVDLHVRRERVHDDISELGLPPEAHVVSVRNPRGWISSGLFSAVDRVISNHLLELKPYKQWKSTMPIWVIQVIGEEDLAVLPVILLAPLGSVVVYGQPPLSGEYPEGLVMVTVTEEKKQEIFTMNVFSGH